MRTKSDGSTNGTGYITPSKPVGRLMLNFMRPSPSERRLQCGCDGAGVVHATQHDVIETDGAVFVEPGPHLRRCAAGSVAAHHVVADQAIDLAPVLGGVGRAQCRLVEPG